MRAEVDRVREREREVTYMSVIYFPIEGLGKVWSNSGAECWKSLVTVEMLRVLRVGRGGWEVFSLP